MSTRMTLTAREVTGSTNVANNTSQLYVALIVKTAGESYNLTGDTTGSIVVDGNSYSLNGKKFGRNATTTIFEQTFTIKHASNGSRSVAVSYTFNTKIDAGVLSGSTVVTMATISQSSTPTILTTGVVYPILYGPDDDISSLVPPYNNGKGILRDILEGYITEEINGQYTLDFTYPVSGPMYDKLVKQAKVVCKTNPFEGELQIFRIQKISRPINGIVSVYAEHISYDMSGYILTPSTYTSPTNVAETIGSYIIGETPSIWQWETDIASTDTWEIKSPISLRNAIGGSNNSFISLYPGEFKFDNFKVSALTSRGANRGVKVLYSRDMVDFTLEEDFVNCYTAVYPYWRGTDGNGNQIIVNPSSLQYVSGMENEKKRILTVDVTSYTIFDEKSRSYPTQEEVEAAGRQYMEDNKIGKIIKNFTLDMVDLGRAPEYRDFVSETILLGDTITIIFPLYGITEEVEVVKYKYNLLTDLYDSIELGEKSDDLSSAIASVRQASDSNVIKIQNVESSVKKEIAETAQVITGNTGGYVVLHNDLETRHPYELLVMDSDNIDEAQKVWRWNQNGLGYSSNGYDGNYTVGINSDGKIQAWMVSAANLEAGTITSKNGSFLLDLDSGDLTMNANQISLNGSNISDYLKFNFDPDTGKPVLQLGYSGNNINLKIMNDRIAFFNSQNEELAYWSNNGFRLVNLNNFQLGAVKITRQNNSSISFVRGDT